MFGNLNTAGAVACDTDSLTYWLGISFGTIMYVVAITFEPHLRSCQFYNCVMYGALFVLYHN